MMDIQILECTLRDASYVIDFQFTAEDTAVVAAGLQDAGFRWIEIGHGLGLHASGPTHGHAAATDEQYLGAAASVLTTARFGCFFIPGIGESQDLNLGAKYGMGFVRIGTNVTETDQAEPHIKHAKQLGLLVSSNLMKTYALPLDDVIRRVVQLDRWGADIICVVDSAGGMLPSEVSRYVTRLRSEVGAAIGFHGHNNLQLAHANVLAALDAGATWIDATLRGMGRSAGNAQTDVILLILQKLGIDLGIDIFKTMDVSERLIAPIVRGRGVDAIEATVGYAGFHSSYLKTIYKVARARDVDPRELIVRVSAIDRVHVTEALAARVADEIRQGRRSGRASSPGTRELTVARGRLPSRQTPQDAAPAIADELRILARKLDRPSVFTIAGSRAVPGRSMFPFVRTSAQHVIGNAEVATADLAAEVAGAVDGRVDVVAVDLGRPSRPLSGLLEAVAAKVRQSRLIMYSDEDAQVAAADAFLITALPPPDRARVVICGTGYIAVQLAVRMAVRGLHAWLWRESAEEAARACEALRELARTFDLAHPVRVQQWTPEVDAVDAVIGATAGEPLIPADVVRSLRPQGLLFDAGVGSLSTEAIEEARARGVRLSRLDMRAGLSGAIAVALDTADLTSRIVGRDVIAGVPIVAGGVIGCRGDVVVDTMGEPTRVIGVADGSGRLLAGEDAQKFREQVERVEQELLRRRLPTVPAGLDHGMPHQVGGGTK
jgi:4-hydroxy 2-oxovalerate aldolase/long-chain acyl-CoA synthetase